MSVIWCFKPIYIGTKGGYKQVLVFAFDFQGRPAPKCPVSLTFN